jgi:hypothetical protein
MPYIREDQAAIHVVIDGKDYGTWSESEGFDLDTDGQKVRPGAQGPEVSAGGPSSRGDGTVRIPYSDTVATWHKALEKAVRSDAPIKVSWQYLVRRQPIGTTDAVTGTLKSAKRPNFSSTGAAVGLYEIQVTCDEVAV